MALKRPLPRGGRRAALLGLAAAALIVAGCDQDAQVTGVFLSENPYRFQPELYELEVNTAYTLEFNDTEEVHTFTVEGLGVAILIPAGEKVTEQITPDQVGTFGLVCTRHAALGMIGTVRVWEET